MSQSSHAFRVFDDAALAPPRGAVAVLDASGTLAEFLDSLGVAREPFGSNAALVLVGKMDPATADADLLSYVEAGGVAVCLELPWGQTHPERPAVRIAEAPWLPFPLRFRDTKGLWTPVAHIIRRHPVTDGLPTDQMMDQAYANVCPRRSMLGLRGEMVAGSVTYGWGQGSPDGRDYRGPEPAFWGADLVMVPHGKGRFVLSTLRLLDQLDRDPVADKLLLNLIRWASAL